MSLSSAERNLVRQSFLKLALDIDQTAQVFYDHLFETSPESAELFKNSDMQSQGRSLMRMLDALVESLDDPQYVQNEMQGLSRRHASYGVTAELYQPFGTALLSTVKLILGEKYTSETGAAWQKAYDLLAGIATSTPA